MTYWNVRIHRLVLSEDFDPIPQLDKENILRTLNKKLSIDPQAYGKALTGEFKGYWRLRAGDYRVIYRIIKSQIVVLVIKVGIRKDDQVYQELVKRLNKL